MTPEEVVKVKAFPESLRSLRQWVAWDYETRGGKPTKVPRLPSLEKKANASSSDPTTWGTVRAACDAAQVHGYAGVGFVFAEGGGVVGVDLDGVRDPETGALDPEAERIVLDLDSYTEVSPSGRGVHVFVRGVLPPGGRRKGPVELYEKGRFFTVTGETILALAGVEERQAQLEALHLRIFGPPPGSWAAAPVDEPSSAPRPPRSPREGPDELARAWEILPLARLAALIGPDWAVVGERVEGPCPEGRSEKCQGKPREAYAYPRPWPPHVHCSHRGSCGCVVPVFELVAARLNGDRAAAARAIKAAAGIAPSPEAPLTWPDEGGAEEGAAERRPRILVTLELADVRDEAERALLGRGVFVHGSRLVKVAAGGDGRRVHAIQPPDLKASLASAALWERASRNGRERVAVPGDVVAALHARGEWGALPELVGISRAPVLRPDGSVVVESGYDAASRLWLDLDQSLVGRVVVPEAPSQDDARAALLALAEPWREFLFLAGRDLSTSHDLTAALALPLSLVARGAYDAPTPLFLFSAPEAGTGKTLAIRAGVALATGRDAPLPPPAERDEVRKQLDSLALEGAPLVLLDNVTSIGGGYLAALLTAPRMTVRKLGASETYHVRPPMIVASANNPEVKGDLGRRVVPCSQDAESARPDERKIERTNLIEWVVEERPRLLGAALTVLRAHALAGRPVPAGLSHFGSFEVWSRVIRGAVIYAGGADPCGGRDALREDADHGEDALGDLLTIWAEHPRLASPVTARTLLAVARELANRDDSDLIDALVGVARVPQDKLNAENVGYSIRGAKRRVRELEDGARVRIAPAGKGRSGQRWTVERVS